MGKSAFGWCGIFLKKLVHKIDSLVGPIKLSLLWSSRKEHLCLGFVLCLLSSQTPHIFHFFENNPIEGLICHNGLLILEFHY